MRAVLFHGRLKVTTNQPEPPLRDGWAKIRVHRAGICQTDLEILKGYMDFSGVLGHEFVGAVTDGADRAWIGRRVVGEINAACGACPWCEKKMGNHCPDRRVLGIAGLDGCMAEYCLLPVENLHPVPDSVSDDRAVFAEPLAAACRVLQQVPLKGSERAIVLGDGRLGILCAWVLATAVADVTLVGRHRWKLDRARWRSVKTVLDGEPVAPGADLVVEATGSADGLGRAASLCRPQGTIVVKTTVAGEIRLPLAPVVVNEQKLVGSRCGPFDAALALLEACPNMPVEGLISATRPLAEAEAAFDRAVAGGVLKVLLDCR